jgi:hypothetical protein
MRQTTVPIDWDALIPGVYNYCDRWCERCQFTSRCAVFQQEQVLRQACRPGPTPAIASPPGSDDQAGFAWEVPDVSEEEIARELEVAERRTKQAAEDPLCVQAQGYGQLVHEWLARQPEPAPASQAAAPASGPPMPEEVIAQFSFYIGAKVYRAVEGVLRDADEDDEDDANDVQSDPNGSAKAALLAIQRSQAAWMRLRPKGPEGLRTAVGLLDVLTSLRQGLEQRFPQAYAFVRPGFDDRRG